MAASTRRLIMNNPSNFSRREFVTLAAAGLSLAGPKSVLASAQNEALGKPRPSVSPDQALRDLLNPEAVIVSCADSRVVPPHVPCVAGRNRSTRGRTAETHAARARFHHKGSIRQCLGPGKAQGQ